MLVFVGIGLGVGGIPLQGLREAREADAVYAELYTSLIPGIDAAALEREVGRSIKVVSRKVVEENPDEILDAARRGKLVFLVPGEPMVATTHVDLRLRAAKAGIGTKVIHAASIASAAPGLAGLQSYKFGPSATVPFQDNPSARPYEILVENLARGLHTLLLLDIRAEEGRAMTAGEAIKVMLNLEKVKNEKTFTERRLVVVVARAGEDDCLVAADLAGNLVGRDFGPPPYVLIVPGRLHFMEAEALKAFAGAPKEALDEIGR
ncbi:MAG: diphthine synthase [Candidatus Hadarchaeota archaeon]